MGWLCIAECVALPCGSMGTRDCGSAAGLACSRPWQWSPLMHAEVKAKTKVTRGDQGRIRHAAYGRFDVSLSGLMAQVGA